MHERRLFPLASVPRQDARCPITWPEQARTPARCAPNGSARFWQMGETTTLSPSLFPATHRVRGRLQSCRKRGGAKRPQPTRSGNTSASNLSDPRATPIYLTLAAEATPSIQPADRSRGSNSRDQSAAALFVRIDIDTSIRPIRTSTIPDNRGLPLGIQLLPEDIRATYQIEERHHARARS